MNKQIIELMKINRINLSVTMDELRKEREELRALPNDELTDQVFEDIEAINKAILELSECWGKIAHVQNYLISKFDLWN